MPKGIKKIHAGYRYQYQVTCKIGTRGRPKVITIEAPPSDNSEAFGARERPPTTTPDALQLHQAQDNSIQAEGATPVSKTWQQRREEREKAWSEKRALLLDAAVKMMVPPSFCSICSQGAQQGIIRCQDCGPRAFFCQNCFSSLHRYTRLHSPEIWKGLLFVPYVTDTEVWSRGDGHSCNNISRKRMRVFDRNGRQHVVDIEICPCEDILVTLLRHQLWAASPSNPSVCIHLELMEWARIFQMEAQVSTRKFLDCVELKIQPSLCDTKRITVYQSVIRDCLGEYQYYYEQMQNTGGIPCLSNIQDGTVCPPCNGNQFQGGKTQLVCIDANLDLARKKSAGRSCHPPKMQGRHFLTQSQVDAFVNEDKRNKSTDTTSELCSDVQAGSSLRLKGKTKTLDEKGVLGSTCRHDFPLLFCNLMHAETDRISYLAILLRELLKLPQLQTGQVAVVNDVACHLEKYLQERYAAIPRDRLAYALPVFHSYGHKKLCQLTKTLSVTPGAGLTDGENMKRLWSYLKAFGPMTKDMSASNRTDLLTYALLHYSRKTRLRLGQSLHQKLDRVNNARDEATQEIATFANGVVTDEMVNKWAADDLQAVLTAPKTSHSSLQEDYAFNLYKLNLNPDDVEAERNVLLAEQSHGFTRSQWGPDSEIYSQCLIQFAAKQREMLLLKMRQKAFERKFLISSLRKYGIGQAASNQIGKQITQATKRLTADMDTFNFMKNCPTNGRLPTEINFAQVCDPQSACFFDRESGPIEHNVSLTRNRKLVAAYKKKERAEEEGVQVEADLNSAMHFLYTQHLTILRLLNMSLQIHGLPMSPEGVTNLGDIVPSFHPNGKVPFLFNKLLALEREAYKLIEAFGLDNVFPQSATAFVNRVLLAPIQQFDEQDEDDSAADLLEELRDEPDAQAVLMEIHAPPSI